jgi:hypothetical protein
MLSEAESRRWTETAEMLSEDKSKRSPALFLLPSWSQLCPQAAQKARGRELRTISIRSDAHCGHRANGPSHVSLDSWE